MNPCLYTCWAYTCARAGSCRVLARALIQCRSAITSNSRSIAALLTCSQVSTNQPGAVGSAPSAKKSTPQQHLYVVQIKGKNILKSAQWLFEHKYSTDDCKKLEDVAGAHRAALGAMRDEVVQTIARADQGMADVDEVTRQLQYVYIHTCLVSLCPVHRITAVYFLNFATNRPC